MNPALGYLLVRSLVNGARQRLLRLKQPRYLFPALVGLVYFAFIFGCYGGRSDRAPGPPDPSDGSAAIEWIGTGIVLLSVGWAWLSGGKGPGIAFTETEVAMLFPAPVPRRELVSYKVLAAQPALAVSGVFAGVFSLRPYGPEVALLRFLGVWVAFNAIFLHQVAANFTLASVFRHGVTGFRRQVPAFLVLAGLVGVVVVGAPPLPRGEFPGVLEKLPAWFGQTIHEPPVSWILAPFRALPLLALSHDLPTFLLRLVPIVAVTALLFVWVIRADVAFEEAAVARSVEITRAVENLRKGKRVASEEESGRPPRRAPWVLGPDGPPEGAFLWKGFTAAVRGTSLVIVVIVVAAIGVVYGLDLKVARTAGAGDHPPLVPIVLAVLAGLSCLFGASASGHSLRGDLEHTAFLKTLPITGPRLVRAEILATVLPAAAVQAGLLLLALALFPGFPEKTGIARAWASAGVASGILLLPCVTALLATVDAAATLLFPAWLPPGAPVVAGGGIEGAGRGILTMLGRMVVLFLGVLVPGALGGVVVLLGRGFLGPSALVLGAVVAAGVMAAELWLLTEWLGGRFDRLDPSDEGLV